MSRGAAGAWFAVAGLTLALAVQIAPSGAQAPAGEQELIERIRRIQGQLEPGAGQPPERAAATEQELIAQIEGIRRAAEDTEGPALDEDEVQALLREGFGVEVLKIEAIEIDSRPAYVVTVMNPPGNDNSAFLVETLVIDGATGGVLGRVPKEPRVGASAFAESSGRASPDPNGREIRRRSHR